MRLARASHDQLERFFRQHFGDERLKLPRANFHGGLFAACLTKTFKISAITFGNRVFVSPEIFTRKDDGKLRAPGRLIAHEATHILQYGCVGHVRFLSRYLREYAAEWIKSGAQGSGRRWAAYRAISFERQAYDVERVYELWARGRTTRGAPE
jgi:hypothetical protein